MEVGGGDLRSPNLQDHFAPVFSEYDGQDITLSAGFQIQIDQLRPHSRGTVRLRSSDPKAAPKAMFNYLEDPRDMAQFVDGYRTAVDLLRQPAFDRFRGEMALGAIHHGTGDIDTQSDADIEGFVRSSSGTDYHPCGTARMGGGDGDEMAVVDGELRVIGLTNLHIVDASVMPNVVSGNLNAPTQMIAMRGADFILGNEQLAPERPKYHFDEGEGGV